MVRILAAPEQSQRFAPAFRERAATFTPELAATWRGLFADAASRRAERADETSAWTLSWPPPMRAASWWLCSGATHALAVTLLSDAWCGEIGARDWSDYSGESRRIAWGLAHAQLLDHLGALVGDTLQVTKEATALPPPLRAMRVGFRVSAPSGSASGLLALPAEAAQMLAEQGERPAPDLGASRVGGLALPIELWWRGLDCALAELGEARTGDILIVGRRAALAAGVGLESGQGRNRRAARGRFDGTRVVIEDARFVPLRDRAKEVDMSDDDQEATSEGRETAAEGQDDAAAAAAAATPGAFGEANIPVRLDLHLGEVSLTLGELASVQPGYVIDLGQRLEEASVDLYVGGRRIGRGDLVAIGDSLGIRIRELGVDGVR